MIALLSALGSMVLTALAEALHARRCKRVARIAFGPSGKPRSWTAAAPALRVVAVGGLAWGLITLLLSGPRATRSDLVPEGGYRHLVVALDVSPSMRLVDAGPQRQQSRARRAEEVLTSVLNRIAADQARVSIVAFYTGAKPVVVDTFDLEIVRNALNDLPLNLAFEVGKTRLVEGIRESVELAKPWAPGSTTLLVVTDGDTIPDTGLPELPASVERTLIVGVGDPRSGSYIDGHQSRQDLPTLRQLATRLRGDFFNANEKHLPSDLLAALSSTLPMRDTREAGFRELALASVALGGLMLAGLPVALAFAGSGWQAGARIGKARNGSREGMHSRTQKNSEPGEKPLYA